MNLYLQIHIAFYLQSTNNIWLVVGVIECSVFNISLEWDWITPGPRSYKRLWMPGHMIFQEGQGMFVFLNNHYPTLWLFFDEIHLHDVDAPSYTSLFKILKVLGI